MQVLRRGFFTMAILISILLGLFIGTVLRQRYPPCICRRLTPEWSRHEIDDSVREYLQISDGGERIGYAMFPCTHGRYVRLSLFPGEGYYEGRIIGPS